MSPHLPTIQERFNTILRDEVHNLLAPYPAFQKPVLRAIMEGGKQIRPMLYLESIVLWQKRMPSQAEYTIAVAIELLHSFYLIHDDLMDGDDMRRDAPTLHKAFGLNGVHHQGEALALIFGDIIFSKAIQLVSLFPDATIRTSLLSLFFEVNNKTAEGQIMECDHSFIPTKQEILDFYTLKTAYYSIYLPLACASLVTKQTDIHRQQLFTMSTHLGIAYQLYDDVLEILGEKKRRNTECSGDLLRLKMTPILAQYMEGLSEAERSKYIEQYQRFEEITEEEEDTLRHVILGSGILADIKTLITEHLHTSESLLETVDLEQSTIIASLLHKYKNF